MFSDALIADAFERKRLHGFIALVADLNLMLCFAGFLCHSIFDYVDDKKTWLMGC